MQIITGTVYAFRACTRRILGLLQRKQAPHPAAYLLLKLSALNEVFAAYPKFMPAARLNTVTRLFQSMNGGGNERFAVMLCGSDYVANGADRLRRRRRRWQRKQWQRRGGRGYPARCYFKQWR